MDIGDERGQLVTPTAVLVPTEAEAETGVADLIGIADPPGADFVTSCSIFMDIGDDRGFV